MKILIITQNELKKKIADNILRSLPEWFGVESSTKEYVNGLNNKTFFAAKKKDEYLGFFAIDEINTDVANLYVLGLKKEFLHQGMGTKIYAEVEKHLKDHHFKYVTVYTVSSKSADTNYAKTRSFYFKLGFSEVYENSGIWDKNNPFLLMIKYIGNEK
ncbi:MAG: GNAT family N-acetyltransferase [Clostridiales bacterium]|nr:GNAT family N-acetyltransferase [Clostridiales bacterium]